MAKPTYQLLQGDVRDCCRSLPAESVHCVVTSPPYWGLRDYGVPGQMGLERTPEEYVAGQVEVFREVKRVLRSDGTLWLNLGDTWFTGAGQCKNPGGRVKRRVDYDDKRKYLTGGTFPAQQPNRLPQLGLKPKDLVGIPWRVAFALQADGWYLRDCIIWHKTNPMPGSMRDRTCTSHEYVFLLSRSRRYYFDQIAISEKAVSGNRNSQFASGKTGVSQHRCSTKPRDDNEMRNPRSVWRISSRSYKEAHFATFPEALPARCIKAGTSDHGVCCECGAPWKRITRKTRVPTRPGTNSKVNRASAHADSPFEQHHGTIVGNRDPERHITRVETVGWEPSCVCGAEVRPATVLDPYNGAGTTGLAGMKLGRDYIGLELNPDYIAMTEKRFSVFSELLF